MLTSRLRLRPSNQLLQITKQRRVSRYLATIPDSSSYKVLVVGGGTGGISVSATLASQFGKGEIAVIEPSPVHSYQPLWTFVGAGLKKLTESQKPTSEVIPRGVAWLKSQVQHIHPDSKTVTLKDGRQVSYEYLVVAPGVELQWDRIEGLRETLGKNGVSSNYSVDSVEKTWENIQKLRTGKAVFTMPSTPVKCAGAPQKIAYLAERYFHNNSLRDKISVDYYTGIGKLFAIEKYATQLNKICQERSIGVNLLHDLIKVDGTKKLATFQKVGTEDKVEVEFDLLHVTPKMGPYSFIRESGLSNPGGWVEVDPGTLAHLRYPNVFSLGDASSCPTSKTAAAITSQSGVVASNLLATANHLEKGLPLSSLSPKLARYDGYTSCPLLVGDKKLILAEFNGYNAQPLETFPYDQSKPSRFSYEITSTYLPLLYWQGLLKGRWHGPSSIRKWLNFNSSN